MSDELPDPASAPAREPAASARPERRPSRRMIAGLLFVVAVICAVTLLPFLGRGSEMLVAPLVGLAATVVLISGRDKDTLERWFGVLPIGIVAEHGIWHREPGGKWETFGPYNKEWKASLLPVLVQYADRLPGSFVEEKEYSIAWHYRAADPEHARSVATELMDNLVQFTANIEVQILKGHKVLEIRNAGVNKGGAAKYWISKCARDFILAVGDDWTDEDLFRSLPPESYSLRVGMTKTHARYNLRNPDQVYRFLSNLAQAAREPRCQV